MATPRPARPSCSRARSRPTVTSATRNPPRRKPPPKPPREVRDVRHRIATRLGLAVLVVTLLGGCTRGDADLRAWIRQEEAKKGVPLEPPPEIKKFEVFTYADEQMRDPFSASPAEQEQAATGGPQPDR